MKKYKIIVSAFFIAALAFLTVASMVNPVRERSESENRNLAQMPKLSVKSVFDGSFTKGYEDFVTDQFVWRDMWIQLKSSVERMMGKTLSNGVYFADDNYFIEHKSNADVDSELLERNIGFLKAFVENMSAQTDGKALVSIAPTASAVLADKLPKFNDEYDWNAALDNIADILGDSFVDLREVLNEHKDEYVFYRTDHHWTTDGAYYAYSEIIKEFGFEPLAKEDFARIVLSEDFLGTVIAKSNIKTEPDVMVKYEAISENPISVSYNLGAKVTNTLYDGSKLDTRDKYAYYLGGNDALIEINTTVDNDRVLMIAKDSYANCLIPFLTSHFEKIYVVDLRYFNLGVSEYTKQTGDVTDALVLYNASGFAADRYVFKLSR